LAGSPGQDGVPAQPSRRRGHRGAGEEVADGRAQAQLPFQQGAQAQQQQQRVAAQVEEPAVGLGDRRAQQFPPDGGHPRLVPRERSVVRSGVPALSFVILGAWCLVGLTLTSWIMSRRT